MGIGSKWSRKAEKTATVRGKEKVAVVSKTEQYKAHYGSAPGRKKIEGADPKQKGRGESTRSVQRQRLTAIRETSGGIVNEQGPCHKVKGKKKGGKKDLGGD